MAVVTDTRRKMSYIENTRRTRDTLAVAVGLVANAVLAGVKTFIGIVGHSPALLADGINSTSDVAYGIVVAVFVRLAGKPADEQHPYGHHQIEHVAALVVGSFVITTAIAIFWNAVNGVYDFFTGQSEFSGAAAVALWVALGTVVLKIVLTRWTHGVGRQTRNAAVLALAYDHRNDVFSAGAATLGILFGRIGYPWVDPLVGAIVAVIVLRTGIKILQDSSSDLMDTLPGKALTNEIAGIVGGVEGVEQVEEVRAHRFGPYLVANVTIGVNGRLSVAEGDRIATRVEHVLDEGIDHMRRVDVHFHPSRHPVPSGAPGTVPSRPNLADTHRRHHVQDRIGIDPMYPRYWNLNGHPVLLLGGSREDNLFQVPDIEEQLDLLHAAGGNYIRCTMSSRDEGDVWPLEMRDGLYDLDIPSEEYWARFDRCMRLCRERGIVAQIEVWDRFDFSRDPWQLNPFNPKNNRNYAAGDIGMAEEYPDHPGKNVQPFFYSVPGEQHNERLLAYQHQFVDQLMAHSLDLPNVLYCMDNETSGSPNWGAYWSEYIKGAAKAAGVTVHTTEMWDAWDVTADEHKATVDHPETYSFVDLSQNNQTEGQANWDNMQAVRASLSKMPRPINNVKIYGAEAKIHHDEMHAQQSFWRAVFGGVAAARFHRPPTGLGIDERVQHHIRSMRMVQECFADWFAAEPANELLSDREENSCYCRAQQGSCIAVVFFGAAGTTVDLTPLGGAGTARWLDVASSAWRGDGSPVSGGPVELSPPDGGFQVAVVTA